MNEFGLRFPIGCTFLGVNCSQTWPDFLLWERFLNAHTIAMLIELGTGEGGFSRYLHAQAEARDVRFLTFDRKNMRTSYGLPYFYRCDVLVKAKEIAENFSPPTAVFCDGGDKPLEVATYTPLLSAGDLIAVHDWGVEISQPNIPKELEMIHEDWCLELHSPTRFFRKEHDA